MPNSTGTGCYHPIDDIEMRIGTTPCFDPGPSARNPVDMCFHPVSPCYHPGDDLVTDLHRALSGADERDLAALS
jgi:hypothetical protein